MIVEVLGTCVCGWNGKVRKYKGRMYCTGPNHCWRKRRTLHPKLERRDKERRDR